MNVAVAVIGILITTPLMAVIAVLIKLTSPGPILFTQPRVGVDRRNGGASADGRRTLDYGGRLFRIYKFRTMKVNGDGDQAVWAVENDPRVTAIGGVLRKYRLDELPQLFNVLKGDMNVVGPRPEQPRIFRDLSLRVPNYTTRQTVMPGITGWAQVNRGYDDSVKAVREKLRFDLEYVERQSLAMDVQIMLRTLPVIAFRRGAR